MESSFIKGAQPYKHGGSVPQATEPELIDSTESTGSHPRRNPNLIMKGSDSGPSEYVSTAMDDAGGIQEIRRKRNIAGIHNYGISLVNFATPVDTKELTYLKKWGIH